MLAEARPGHERHHGLFSCDAEAARAVYCYTVQEAQDLQEHSRYTRELGTASCGRSATARTTVARSHSETDATQALRADSRCHMEVLQCSATRSLSFETGVQTLAYPPVLWLPIYGDRGVAIGFTEHYP